MPAAVQKVPLKRIRDLLALAKSPEPHEAALARKRADELLGRHGLTEADLVESATEVAPLNPGLNGNQREELARVVARSRGVSAKIDRVRANIAFVGYPEAARDARELFCELVNIVEKRCEVQGDNSDRFLWRTCFWLGFVSAVQQQLDPEHAAVPKEALPTILNRASAPADIEHAKQAFEAMRDRLRGTLDSDSAHRFTEHFKTTANDNGWSLGMQITVPGYRGKK